MSDSSVRRRPGSSVRRRGPLAGPAAGESFLDLNGPLGRAAVAR